MNERKRLYTLLQVANQELAKASAGWSEDCYRDLLQRHGATEKSGKVSATTMDLGQLERALREMKALGFKPRANRKASPANNWRGPRIGKLNAMWCAMADAGVVKNRSSEAMHKWCEKNVPGLSKLPWATGAQLNKAVEMMKAMARANGVELV
ncbi:MAG: regulatory protein GemA [Pseudomonadales bacterium]